MDRPTTSPIKALGRELRRRKIVRACIFYFVGCWGVLQVTEKIASFLKFDLTEVSPTLFTLAIAGFPLTIILAWFYQVSAKGITRKAPFVERRVLCNLAPLEDRREEIPPQGQPSQQESAYDWILEMESGPLSGLRYGVDSNVVVGRSLGCELTIPIPHISREHARFILDGGQLLVEDLGSSNGTLVNGVKIASTVYLSHQDIVEILDVTIRVKESPAHAIAHSHDTTVVHNNLLNCGTTVTPQTN